MESMNNYKTSSIMRTLEDHKKIKCYFCKEKGACSTCANLRCTGPRGWYHFPCGLQNQTVQINNKTFCSKKHSEKEIRILKVNRESQGRSKSRKVTPKKLKKLSDCYWTTCSEQVSCYTSCHTSCHTFIEQGETKQRRVDNKWMEFLFYKIQHIPPVMTEASTASVYTDVDTQEDEVVQTPGILDFNIQIHRDGENVTLHDVTQEDTITITNIQHLSSTTSHSGNNS